MGATRGFTTAAMLAIAGCMVSARARAGDQPDPHAKAAAKYLDARAAEWAAFSGADRGQGADKVSCLSCHTSLSYALARPALRRAAGEDKPSAHEERLLANVRRRVANWKDLDTPRFSLSYDFDERKKVESWGTEAVMNALVLAFDDRRHGLKTPSDPTREAFRHFWAKQLTDGPDKGSWDWLEFGLNPWESKEVGHYYGATLAAIAIGSAPGYADAKDDPKLAEGIERLRGYISSHKERQSLHNLIWTLWASTAIDGLLTASEQADIIKRVLEKQQDNGGWSVASLVDCKRHDKTSQETAPDGYATGLVLHVLQLAGLPKDHAGVSNGLAWLRANQQATGGWVGNSLNKKRDHKTNSGKFMSDAATAFAVLALERP